MARTGLAQTAVHPAKAAALYPPSVLGAPSAPAEPASSVRSLFSSLSLNPFAASAAPDPAAPAPPSPHALTILARLLRDPAEAPHNPPDDNDAELVDDVLGNAERTGHIRDLAEEWARGVDLAAAGALDAKLEELAWTNALVFGVGGWKAGGEPAFKADFFL